MRYSIHQLTATTWELRDRDGATVGMFDDSPTHRGYDLAVAVIASKMNERAAAVAAAPEVATDDDGLLPDWWASDEGIAFSVDTAGGRDFSACTWTARDPATSLLPVMFQTQNLPAHMEAELAGFIAEITCSGTKPVQARGRFYANEAGQAAHDVLLGGRRFGVSVDPTENVDVDESFVCTDWDEEGFCVDGEGTYVFNAYEIGGFTMEPHPCFENASIVLESADAAAASSTPPARVAASALTIPTAPPCAWMTLAEPAPGQPFLDGEMGEEFLVEQTDRQGNVLGMACPLTIRDDGLVYGHLTYWGQCHTGNPWGAGVCASAAPSSNGYRDFHAGTVACDDGTTVPTGELVVGCEHSSAFDVAGVRDHLARAGMGWASVHVSDGQFGPWVCGVLRPDLTEAQVRVLRALSLSGEWISELGGILAVNASGLPIQRERLAASAAALGWTVAPVALRASRHNGVTTKLVGGNIVRRCPECAKRNALARGTYADTTLLRQMGETLAVLERRTRHLVPVEAEAVRASFGLAESTNGARA